jgi:type II secretory pathway predicted ATPase ExeA
MSQSNTSNKTQPNRITVHEHFGCKYAPFSDTFTLRETWASKADSENLRRMETLLEQGKSFSLVGDPGTGKSMLIKALLEKLDTKVYRHVLIPWAGQRIPQILREICDKIGLDTVGRTPLLQRLHKAFSRQGDGPYTVLVIDEAHSLPREAWQELFSLTSDHLTRTAGASIILCGHPMLTRILDLDINSAIRTRIAMRFVMATLSESEVDDFVRFRLKVAKADPGLFLADAMQTLHVDSKGNRRLIMNLAGNAMSLAVERSETVVSDELVREVGNMG